MHKLPSRWARVISFYTTRRRTGLSGLPILPSIEKARRVGKEHVDYVQIWTKDPCAQAFTGLMNFALGKPAQQVQLNGTEGGPVVFKWQEAGQSG